MPSSILRFCFVTTTAALVAASPAIARADESEGARLFREGRALMLEERFAEACPRLEQSQRLEPRGGTLLNVAACHERAGRIATAWAEYHDALVTARTEGQTERMRLAEQRVAALTPRLPWLSITVTAEAEAQGVRVTFDGAEIQRIAWGKDMPIDPGEHVILVTAAGRVEHVHHLVVRESQREKLEVTALAATPAPAPAPAPAEPAPAEPAPVIEPEAPAPVTPPPAPRLGRWVFEAGVFAGYMTASMDRTHLDGDESGISVWHNTPEGGEPTSCAEARCSYSLGRRSSLVGGVSLFAGFAATDSFHLGGRIIAGPRLRGGAIFATGPSASLHMWGPLWVGASLLVGIASQSERSGTVTAPPGYSVDTSGYNAMTSSTDVGFGLGFELRAELFKSARGAFAINTQPLFLAGSPGSAFVLPFGVSYRWR